MPHFTIAIKGNSLTPQNIETKLKLSLEKLIRVNDKEIFKISLFVECQSLVGSYINLMQHYTSIKQEENRKQIVSGFLQQYEFFTQTFTRLIKKNKFSKTVCCIITHVWLEILKDLEKEGKAQSDMLARSISAQMQTDLIRILESHVNLP